MSHLSVGQRTNRGRGKMSSFQDIKELIKEEHHRAELQRLNDGWGGCGCQECQQFYKEIDLSIYGSRVHYYFGDMISITDDKVKLAQLLGDKWVGSEQICIIQGQGYATAPDLSPLFMGSEDEVMEALRTRTIPTGTTPLQQDEYNRIFEQLKKEGEFNESGEYQAKPGSSKRVEQTYHKRAGFTSDSKYQPQDTRHFKKGT